VSLAQLSEHVSAARAALQAITDAQMSLSETLSEAESMHSADVLAAAIDSADQSLRSIQERRAQRPVRLPSSSFLSFFHCAFVLGSVCSRVVQHPPPLPSDLNQRVAAAQEAFAEAVRRQNEERILKTAAECRSVRSDVSSIAHAAVETLSCGLSLLMSDVVRSVCF
jgi:hypothetical protein